jgi:hypothetical protein
VFAGAEEWHGVRYWVVTGELKRPFNAVTTNCERVEFLVLKK